MNARTKAQKDAEWLRAYGSAERVEWISRQPSVISGKRPCVNAHIKTGGMGRKADCVWIVPLTFDEHNEIHQHGQETFAKKHGIDLEVAAVETEMKWRAQKGEW